MTRHDCWCIYPCDQRRPYVLFRKSLFSMSGGGVVSTLLTAEFLGTYCLCYVRMFYGVVGAVVLSLSLSVSRAFFFVSAPLCFVPAHSVLLLCTMVLYPLSTCTTTAVAVAREQSLSRSRCMLLCSLLPCRTPPTFLLFPRRAPFPLFPYPPPPPPARRIPRAGPDGPPRELLLRR